MVHKKKKKKKRKGTDVRVASPGLYTSRAHGGDSVFAASAIPCGLLGPPAVNHRPEESGMVKTPPLCLVTPELCLHNLSKVGF